MLPQADFTAWGFRVLFPLIFGLGADFKGVKVLWIGIKCLNLQFFKPTLDETKQ